MSLNDTPSSNDHVRKAESRGHNRNFSTSSQLSSSSYTSGTSTSSLSTRRSSSISDSPVDIYHPDELVPGALAGISQAPSAYRPMKALKAIFRRSKQYGPKDAIDVNRPGSIDRLGLEAVVSAHHAPREEVTSFKMAPGSYVAYSRLAEVLEYLSQSLPNVQDVVLYAQVFTLEELNGLTPFITRFTRLRTLAIFDAMDDPPMVCPTLCKIITHWAVDCPTLQRVQFKSSSWWESKYADLIDEKERTAEWVERTVDAN